MTDTSLTTRGVRRRPTAAQYPTLPDDLRVALVGERDPVLQLAMICDHLRPRLIRAARQAGAGDWAEDVVADVVARRFRIVVADAPITLATPQAFNHLTASLLVSVRNAAMSHRRDTARLHLVPDYEVGALIDRDALDTQPSSVAHPDELRALAEALRGLDSRDAQIARLIGIHEMTVRDVANRLGIGASTVHDVWTRVQRIISADVERVLSGALCRQAGPHLALISSQHRSDRSGHDDSSLSDVVGVEEARRLVSHVYGSGDLLGGCPACRHALVRQRQLLHHGLPVPVIGLAGAETTDGVRELFARLWNAATTALVRMSDAIWGLVSVNPIPGAAGATTTTLGIGVSKIAAVVAASALATSAPALVTDMRADGRPAHPRAGTATSRTVSAPSAATTHAAQRRTAATAQSGRAATRSAASPTASQPTRHAPASATSDRAASAPARAAAEFSPGP